MIQAEGNGCCSAACMVELELRSLTRRRDSVCISFAVDEAVEQVVSVLVGDYTLNGLAGTGTNSIYLDSRACRSILVTDISAYFTVRVTRTDGSLADGLDIPVALVGHRQAVFPFTGDERISLFVFVPTAVVLLLQYRPSGILTCRTGLDLVRSYIPIG